MKHVRHKTGVVLKVREHVEQETHKARGHTQDTEHMRHENK